MADFSIDPKTHDVIRAAAQVDNRMPGSKISNVTVNGGALDPAAGYRVSVNNFLAAGRDGFAAFTNGTDLAGGPVDLDAFTAYLTAHSPISPRAPDRVTIG